MTKYHFAKKTVRDVPIHDTRVLLRADFNVPMQDGVITSDYRIAQTVPTIQYLISRGCEVVILAHLGRPEGKRNLAYSLESVAQRLGELLQQPVAFVEDCANDSAKQALKRRTPKRVTLLENVRFYPGEEANEPEFARRLINVSQPDYVVQDGFGVVHRAHASTEGISHIKPAVAGLLLEREVTTLSSAMQSPKRPLVAVLGGAKISDKLPLVERFIKTADTILVGGAMANNFIAAAGHGVGTSLVDPEGMASVASIIAAAQPDQLVTPVDVVVANEVSDSAKTRICGLDEVADDEKILDVGPKTIDLFCERLKTAHTVIWNGTMGMSEFTPFSKASAQIAAYTSGLPSDTISIVGGGDTADFVLDWQKNNTGTFTHISTGGGASLELLSGLPLPGVEALLS